MIRNRIMILRPATVRGATAPSRPRGGVAPAPPRGVACTPPRGVAPTPPRGVAPPRHPPPCRALRPPPWNPFRPPRGEAGGAAQLHVTLPGRMLHAGRGRRAEPGSPQK